MRESESPSPPLNHLQAGLRGLRMISVCSSSRIRFCPLQNGTNPSLRRLRSTRDVSVQGTHQLLQGILIARVTYYLFVLLNDRQGGDQAISANLCTRYTRSVRVFARVVHGFPMR